MTYTETERKQLIHNIEQMIDYIKVNIQPYVRDHIEVDFGGVHYNPRSWTQTTNYHLRVEPKDILYAVKYGNYHKFATEACDDASEEKYFKIAHCADDMVAFVSNWQDIKAHMNCAVAEQKRIVEAINNFKI